jgi:hypothetical protein
MMMIHGIAHRGLTRVEIAENLLHLFDLGFVFHDRASPDDVHLIIR